jgi:serine protease Do
MRRALSQKTLSRGWVRWASALLVAAWLAMSPGGAVQAAAPDALEVKALPLSPSPSETLAAGLRQVFDGGAPRGLADLRAMQSHVQKLTDKLTKCTVGVQVGQAWGSGVIISKDGYVLTAAHVAGKPNRRSEFRLSDGRTVKGKTLGLFKTLDAGIMKIVEPGEYPFAEMGDSGKLHLGQWCVAMGHPGGYQEERGAVLRLGRIVIPTTNDAITTDCTLVGGDSGGPLFDMEGHVIGINSRIAGPLTANMHVPISAFQSTWDRLTKGEAWGHLPGHEPYLGVGGKSADSAEIGSVRPKSPAEKAGIQTNDIVVKFDDKEIKKFGDLIEAVAECQPDEEVKVQVRRGEQTIDLTIKLGKKE